MICSSAGIIDFAAVEAEALGAGEFEVAEFLEALRYPFKIKNHPFVRLQLDGGYGPRILEHKFLSSFILIVPDHIL